MQKKVFHKNIFYTQLQCKIVFSTKLFAPRRKVFDSEIWKKVFRCPENVNSTVGGQWPVLGRKNNFPTAKSFFEKSEPAAKLWKMGYGCRNTVWKIMWKNYRLAGREAKFQALGTRYIACGRLFASTRTGFGLHASARSPSRSAEQAQTQSVS